LIFAACSNLTEV